MKEFAAFRAKTQSYSRDNNNRDEKAKSTKKYVIKRKLKIKDNKNGLKATQLQNKVKQQENKVNTEYNREIHNAFKINKLILKKQQRLSERHNDFTEEIK